MFRSFFKAVALAVLFVYSNIVSPAIHFSFSLVGYPTACRFPESCSAYAKRQIVENNSIISSTYTIFKRLLSCGPWGRLRSFQ